jgi:hypothetical protein
VIFPEWTNSSSGAAFAAAPQGRRRSRPPKPEIKKQLTNATETLDKQDPARFPLVDSVRNTPFSGECHAYLLLVSARPVGRGNLRKFDDVNAR